MLCSVRGPGGVLCRAFHTVAIPQSGLLVQVSSLWLHSGHSGLILKKQCSPSLSAQPPLASGGCRRLCCFSTRGVTVGLVVCGFNYLFIFPPCYVALCSSKAHHTHSSESVSWCLETSLFLRLPSHDGAPSLPLLSLFSVFYIFPTCFRRQ